MVLFKRLYIYVALSLISFAPPLLADDLPSQKSDSTYQAKDTGGYVEKNTTVTTEPNGTVITDKVTKDVTYDRFGNKSETDDIKKTTDPKGLFNKTTTEIKNKSAEMPDGGKDISHKETVNGKTIEENSEKISPP